MASSPAEDTPPALVPDEDAALCRGSVGHCLLADAAPERRRSRPWSFQSAHHFLSDAKRRMQGCQNPEGKYATFLPAAGGVADKNGGAGAVGGL